MSRMKVLTMVFAAVAACTIVVLVVPGLRKGVTRKVAAVRCAMRGGVYRVDYRWGSTGCYSKHEVCGTMSFPIRGGGDNETIYCSSARLD